MGDEACGTCEDFDFLESLVRRDGNGNLAVMPAPPPARDGNGNLAVMPAPPPARTEAQLVRARVLVERMRLDHQRAHAHLGRSEPDPFPANLPASSSEGAKQEAAHCARCGHSFGAHFVDVLGLSGGRGRLCSDCVACPGYVPGG